MSWFASIVVGILSAIVGLLAAGWIASMAVDWYSITSREGASGYFVVFMAFLGLVAGLVIGIAASRVVAGGANPGFGKAFGYAQAVLLGAATVIGGVARLMADVPPTLNGQALMLAVEIRWPAGVPLPAASDTGEWWLRLSASSGRTVRVSERGPLWRDDAHQVDGRWVVPGAVEVFTSRGDRILDVEPSGLLPNGFIVPLPAYPKAKQLEWSDWIPRARDGGPAPAGGFTYRFRVVPRNQPIRTETAGSFELQTIAHWFSDATYGNGPTRYSARAEFAIRYRGRPVVIEGKSSELDYYKSEDAPTYRYEHGDAVAVIGGPQPALLVQVGAQQGAGHCFMLVGNGDTLRTEYVGYCGNTPWATLLTSDPAAFKLSAGLREPDGRVDRVTFANGGAYLFTSSVVDTRTLTVRRFPIDNTQRLVDKVPALGVSPDGRSFARLGFGENEGEHVLYVRDIVTGDVRVLPITTHVNGYEYEQLDPGWLSHYFAWERGGDGIDRLVERKNVTPLPPHGVLSVERDYGEYRVYRAKRSLRDAVIDLLVAEFKAERIPAKEEDFAHEVRIEGRTVNVSFDGSDEEGHDPDGNHVGVWTDRGTDTKLVEQIAKRLDAALAAGTFDRHLYR